MNNSEGLYHIQPHKVRLAAGGRIVIPAEIREELGIKEGDELLLTPAEDGIRLTTYREAVRQARDLVAKYVKPGVSLADELSRDRADEAAREERGNGKGSGRKRK